MLMDLLVRRRKRAMVSTASCGLMVAQPIEPRPPAFATAAASSTVPNPAIGASRIGCSMLNSSTRRRSGHIARLLPTAGGPAAVDMKDLAGDERRLLKIHHGVGDLLRLTHSAHRLQ